MSQEKEEIASQGNVQAHMHIFNKGPPIFHKSRSNHATIKLSTLDA